MTIQELYEKCKGREDYEIIVDGDNSVGWCEVCDEIDIDDERKEIGLYTGFAVQEHKRWQIIVKLVGPITLG